MAPKPEPTGDASAPASTVESALAEARRTLGVEARGLALLAESLDSQFAEAVEIILRARGHTIVTGMGKSGHIAHKIASTLASTGTPAFFVHPGEASHGDLGMVTRDNAVLALSNSGETQEISDIVAYTRRHQVPLIAMTSRGGSPLAEHADVALVIPSAEEACPHGLAPTTSTTMMLALGDALAIALLGRRGFTRDDFHAYHPGGRLGALLIKVRDVMHGPEKVPSVRLGSPMSAAIDRISAGRFGLTAVLDDSGHLAGIITDGDIRRHATRNLAARTVDEVMTSTPKSIAPDALAIEALRIMNEGSITALFVMDGSRLAGLIHIHDCLKAGLG
jgi:arabinose-5-phosphate isomerase